MKVSTFIHKIVKLTSIEVRRKNDLFGKEAVLVDDVQYRFYYGLPQNAPEGICKRILVEFGAFERSTWSSLSMHYAPKNGWGLETEPFEKSPWDDLRCASVGI